MRGGHFCAFLMKRDCAFRSSVRTRRRPPDTGSTLPLLSFASLGLVAYVQKMPHTPIKNNNEN